MGKFGFLNLRSSSSSSSGAGGGRMGCAGSKTEGNGGDSESGGGGSKKGDKGGGGGGGGTSAAGGANAATDSRIPMTAKQKYSIVASWKGISRALESTGVSMFVKLFEDNIELLDLFEKFRTKRTREQQEESLELAEHATMVMSTIDHAIRSLDNPDNFVQYLEQVGSQHRRIPGFNKDFFWKIEKPFLEAVKTTLDERYTDNMETIYKIVIRLILETLVKGYEKAGQ